MQITGKMKTKIKLNQISICMHIHTYMSIQVRTSVHIPGGAEHPVSLAAYS